MKKDFWREWFRPDNKKTPINLALALLIGIVLLISSKSLFPTIETEKEVVAETPLMQEIANTSVWDEAEKKTAEILSQIEGAGEVRVMITYKTTTENVIATEESREEILSDENGRKSESLKQETSIVMTEDGNGNTTPIVLTQDAAKVEGVVIVAQGGNQAVVKNALVSAAQALFDVPANKIAVLKMR